MRCFRLGKSVYLIYVYEDGLEMLERVETNYKRARGFAQKYSIEHGFRKVIVSRYLLDKHENWDIYDSYYDSYLKEIKEFNKKLEKEKQRLRNGGFKI